MKSFPTPKMAQLNRVRPKNRLVPVFAAFLLPFMTLSAATVYWDINGTATGATTSGVGDASGTWNDTNAFFNSNSAGNPTAPGVYVDNSDVVFSAGSNATGASTITVAGLTVPVIDLAVGVASLTINTGTVTFNSDGSAVGRLVTRGTNVITLGASAGGSATFNTEITTSGGFLAQTFANQNTNVGRNLIFNGAISVSGTTGQTVTLTLANTSAGGTTVNGSLGSRGDVNFNANMALIINNTGSGVTMLAGGNVYTGTTTVSAGTLVVSSDAINVSAGNANESYTRSGNTLTVTAGGYANGDRVVFNNVTTPTGLTPGVVYYVVGQSGNTFQLSATSGGGAIALSGLSSSSNAISKAGALGSTNSTVQLGDASTGSNSVSLLVNGAHTVQRAISVNNFGTATTLGGNSDHNSVFSGAIALSKTANLQSVTTGANTLTVSGVVSGSGGITKTGSGSVTFSAVNTYTGTTLVSGGTLILSGSGSIADSTTVNVASGATLNTSAHATYTYGSTQTLRGNGTITGNTVIQGTLAAGNSPGILTFSNNLTLDGSNSQFEINSGSPVRGTTYDGVNVGGILTYDGILTLTMGSLISDGTYNLFDFTSIGGNFDSVVFAGGIYAGTFTQSGGFWTATDTLGSGQTFRFELASGDLSVIPEPSTTLLLTGALTALVIFRRRRA